LLTHSPSPQSPSVVSDPVAVEERLKALDSALTENLLLEANQRGYEARVDTTLAHAPTAAGTLHWHAFVPALRLALKEQGWSIKDHKNCPLIISADKSIAIVVMTGNIETGKEFGNPTNQADKGAVLDEAVQRNHQYQLFESAALSELQKGEGGTQLWVLLYHVEGGAKGVKEIRTELSLPSSFQKKKIVGWAERIILRPISTDKARDFVPELPADTIDVIVERKSGT
jgi:hypothetical protein